MKTVKDKRPIKQNAIHSSGRYQESFEKRNELMNMLAPYAVSEYQLRSLHNPAKGTVKFNDKASDKSHVVKFFVSQDKNEIFKYKGRLYNGSRMNSDTKKKVLRLMEE
jgi:hypothetical protein